ncbi:hypothetical protein BJ875DRAFT_430561 [Amylocarpus encephaloides]|uniref:SWIM-type domain-containing protein n=1 Tax=Amylocarpus encephaloides TaxID=45428 RepID=A0A9P8C2G5_9HELO|nr:hypothetical protein BJ875DRAFT_430561 [Amylocarpus encephaloides]
MTLPTPRTLLTALINTLTTTPSTNDDPSTLVNEPYSMPSNPFQSLPPAQRKILTTLHVLFPAGMVLQSLDLLDRDLAVKITRRKEQGSSDQPEIEPLEHTHLSTKSGKPARDPPRTPRRQATFYRVRSSQAQKSRFSHRRPAPAQVYSVSLAAWNCSCAAFAFSAFASASSSNTPWSALPPASTFTEEEEEAWEFGGLSLDGKEGEDGRMREESVPVCKHLLACLLAERWGDVLGGRMEVREIGREEMGGLAGEG